MDIGMVGLGKMGANMATRLIRGGHRVVGYDLSEASILAAEAVGAEGARTLEELAEKLQAPRHVWVMVPSGNPTEQTLMKLADVLAPGDVLIDGGNSNYKDTMRRATVLAERELEFVDVGTSGGIWGLTEGYSMMVGGKQPIVERLSPILKTLAPDPEHGWGYVGKSGAGHFVKMIHNGIEYGLMQAYAEGFELMHKKVEFDFDLQQIAEIWRHGSVIRSWLLDLTAEMLKRDQDLTDIQGWVADSGEGRWTVAEAIDLDVPAPVATLSLLMRFVSRQKESYAAKMLAGLRNEFGGHVVRKEQ